MGMSGIKLHECCKAIFDEMKITKKDCKQTRKMAFFRISDDDTQVISDDEKLLGGVEISRDPDRDEEMFKTMVGICKELESSGKGYPVYILFDFRFRGDGNLVEKLVLINWCPDSLSIKKKMKFAATSDTVKKAFNGIAKFFEIKDTDDFNYEDLKQEVKK